MNGAGGAEVDTADLVRGMAQLATGLEAAGPAVGIREAQRVASSIRSATPSRTGRLRASITATATTDGAEVHYGGGLPYAGYIAKRSRALDGATADAESSFRRGLEVAAAGVIRTL